jgi:hypothetical protein
MQSSSLFNSHRSQSLSALLSNMNRFVQKLLLLFICLAPKIEKLFGLSPFRYRNKRIQVLTLSSYRVIIISFIILYPISCIRTLDFFRSSDSDVTKYARNLTFAFNWLLLVFIFGNEALNADYNGFSEMERMLRDLIKRQNFNDNLTLLMRCTVKVTLIFSGLFYVKFTMNNFHINRNLMTWEKALVPLLYLPIIILSLASNRIYVANSIVKQCLLMNASNLKPSEMQVKHCTVVYMRLHSFFVRFNKFNAINLLAVVCFCMLNIVYQVIKSSSIVNASHSQAFVSDILFVFEYCKLLPIQSIHPFEGSPEEYARNFPLHDRIDFHDSDL